MSRVVDAIAGRLGQEEKGMLGVEDKVEWLLHIESSKGSRVMMTTSKTLGHDDETGRRENRDRVRVRHLLD